MSKGSESDPALDLAEALSQAGSMALKRLLDWLGGKRDENRDQPTATAARIEKAKRNRATRVRLQPLHRVYWVMDGGTVGLNDISMSGMGLLREAFPGAGRDFSPGQFIDGELVIDEDRRKSRVRIVHFKDNIVGCEFVEPSRGLQQMIEAYFNVELETLRMTQLKSEMLNAEPDGTPSFFHGRDCELFFVVSGDDIVRFHLSFMGNFVEGGRGQRLKTGRVVRDSRGGRNAFPGTELIHWDPLPVESTAEIAARIVRVLEGIGDSERQGLLNLLKVC